MVLERGERVGGVWNKNTYPGRGVRRAEPSLLLLVRAQPALGPALRAQPEIQRYVEGVARKHGVLDRVRLGTDVTSAEWDADAARWRLADERRRGGGGRARVRLRPVDARRRSRDLPGLERFAGPAFHSSQWRHDVDLRGLRVGAIGQRRERDPVRPGDPAAGRLADGPAAHAAVDPAEARPRLPALRHGAVRALPARSARRPLRLLGVPRGGHRGVHRARARDAAARRDRARRTCGARSATRSCGASSHRRTRWDASACC